MTSHTNRASWQRWPLACFAAALTWITPGCAKPAPQPCVAIATTNDIHGAIDAHILTVGDKNLRYGGLLVLASYIERLRVERAGRLLLVDAGDLYQGTLTSNLSDGRAIITAMNYLGYDAATIGNHEFDFGAGKSWRPHDGEIEPNAEERLGVLKERIAEAKFPFVVSNVLYRASGTPVHWQNTMTQLLLEKGGVRIGILGAATPETPRITGPLNVAALDFVDPTPLIISGAKSLRAAGAQLIVLIAHMGGGCDKTDNAHDASSCDLPDGELFTVLKKLPAGTVDVAVGGHTHQVIAHWINGTATLQASARARALGWVDACVKPQGGIDEKTSLIHPPVYTCLDAWPDGTCGPRQKAEAVVPATFLGKPVASSEKLAELLRPFTDQVRDEAARPLGVHLTAPLARDTPSGDSPLGMVMCEAMRRAGKATIAIQNRGGLRADLPAGDLTFAHVFEVMPFDNRLAVLDLSGRELKEVLSFMYSRRGGKPYVLGLTVEETPGGLRLTLPNGKALDEEHHYDVATNDYLASGGEGLSHVLKDIPAERLRVLDLELRDALVNYLRESQRPARLPDRRP
jgi:5'-nucleotidase